MLYLSCCISVFALVCLGLHHSSPGVRVHTILQVSVRCIEHFNSERIIALQKQTCDRGMMIKPKQIQPFSSTHHHQNRLPCAQTAGYKTIL